MTMSHFRVFDFERVLVQGARALALSLLLACVACSGADDRAPIAHSNGLGTAVLADELPCSEGEVRECSIFIKERAGVITCAPGIQICESGRFSECEAEGTSSSEGAAGAPFDD